jgi:hypothetical protein
MYVYLAHDRALFTITVTLPFVSFDIPPMSPELIRITFGVTWGKLGPPARGAFPSCTLHSLIPIPEAELTINRNLDSVVKSPCSDFSAPRSPSWTRTYL